MVVLCAPEAFSTAWHVCCRSHTPVELINWRPRFHGMVLVLTGRLSNAEFHRSLRYRPGCFPFFWPRCCRWLQKWWVCEVLVTFSYPMLRARQGRKGWKRQCIHPKQIFVPTACQASMLIFSWQDQVCMKHGRYDRSLSVACLRISITFHVTCVNVTNLGICRRDQRGWESSCQREAASGLPDIGKPSFHQIICILWLYIYIYIIHLQHLPMLHGYCMQSVCTHPALGLRHDMVSISYGIGEVAGDFVRDAAASGKRGSNSQNSMFLLFFVLFTLCLIWCPASGSWNNWFLWWASTRISNARSCVWVKQVARHGQRQVVTFEGQWRQLKKSKLINSQTNSLGKLASACIDGDGFLQNRFFGWNESKGCDLS